MNESSGAVKNAKAYTEQVQKTDGVMYGGNLDRTWPTMIKYSRGLLLARPTAGSFLLSGICNDILHNLSMERQIVQYAISWPEIRPPVKRSATGELFVCLCLP